MHSLKSLRVVGIRQFYKFVQTYAQVAHLQVPVSNVVTLYGYSAACTLCTHDKPNNHAPRASRPIVSDPTYLDAKITRLSTRFRVHSQIHI